MGAGSSQHLREVVGESVDVGFRVHLGDAHERALPELGIFRGRSTRHEDAAPAQRGVQLGDRSPVSEKSTTNSLKNGPLSAGARTPGSASEPLGRVAGARP